MRESASWPHLSWLEKGQRRPGLPAECSQAVFPGDVPGVDRAVGEEFIGIRPSEKRLSSPGALSILGSVAGRHTGLALVRKRRTTKPAMFSIALMPHVAAVGADLQVAITLDFGGQFSGDYPGWYRDNRIAD